MKIIALLFIVSFSLGARSQDCSDVPSLNRQIVKLAQGKIKKKVGKGECWDLAYYVLQETNAEWDKFEVYGRLINPKKECIYPGDIIQFEKIKLKWKDGKYTYSESMMHHTAIVYKVKDKNNIVLLHQNTGEHGKKVGVSDFNFEAIVSGKLFIYRPVKN